MFTRRSFIEVAGTAAATEIVGATPVLATVGNASSRTSGASAAAAVLHRLLGRRADAFSFTIAPATDGSDYFKVSGVRGSVHILGNRPTSLCRGAYHYLRHACHAMVTWGGIHLDLPDILPDFEDHVRSPYRHLQYLNPCTFGYTMAFWDWARWERELDWMALHGINMPLALEGQEIIWARVWKSFGVSDDELDRFFVGPAHLPWHRMGNINAMAGPLPRAVMENRQALQHKILGRMRELGMDPITPAFSGFVPQGFRRLFPQAKVDTLLWSYQKLKSIPRDTRTFLLHPDEQDLYERIGGRFLQEYRREYGAARHYLADSYNELTPPVRAGHKLEDLRKSAQTVFRGIQAGDPDGIWVMQAWLFVHSPDFWDADAVKAYLSGAPDERMLVLDYANDLTKKTRAKYASEQWKAHKGFYGKPWMNGMIITFGGSNTLKGDLRLAATQPASVLIDPDRGRLVAWGICAEGIENNEVVFELLTDMGWQSDAVDIARWLEQYYGARYGSVPASVRTAGALLLRSAYSTHVWNTKHAWQRAPSDQPSSVGVDAGPDVRQAARLLLSAWQELKPNILYRNDLIEIVVQAAGGHVDHRLAIAVQALAEGNGAAAIKQAAAVRQLLLRIDSLLHLRPDRRLENFVAAGRALGTTPAQAVAIEQGGRQLVTTWGVPELKDYAGRVWSGLTRDFYAPRWTTWIEQKAQGLEPTIELWELDWLSTPYVPSPPLPVTDLAAECARLLDDTEDLASISD